MGTTVLEQQQKKRKNNGMCVYVVKFFLHYACLNTLSLGQSIESYVLRWRGHKAQLYFLCLKMAGDEEFISRTQWTPKAIIDPK